MAKETLVTILQNLPLENKGIEINVWEEGVKGGRLVINKASVVWYARNSKKPTWEGSWEQFARALANYSADCDHCGKPNRVVKTQQFMTCEYCGKRSKLER